MNEKIVMTAEGYDRIDGRKAYQSAIKRLTMGAPLLEENQQEQVALQIWKENKAGELEVAVELPLHQVMDLMIFLSRTLSYFQEAYRLPLLYDPENPVVERVGLQGGVMPVSVCMENPHLEKDIQGFSQALSNLGELTGERLRVLTRILAEMGYD